MKKCPCGMGTLARPGFYLQVRTGKSAHPTSRYDNSCRSPLPLTQLRESHQDYRVARETGEAEHHGEPA